MKYTKEKRMYFLYSVFLGAFMHFLLNPSYTFSMMLPCIFAMDCATNKTSNMINISNGSSINLPKNNISIEVKVDLDRNRRINNPDLCGKDKHYCRHPFNYPYR